MGRPGIDEGGGGSFGGHDFGRLSGGHQVGGTRPGTDRSGTHAYGYGYRGPTYMRFGGHNYYGGEPNHSLVPSVIVTIIIFAILLILGSCSNTSSVKSTRERTKIENPVPYTNHCIEDELGYIEEPQKLSKDLQYFYEKTGIQPYILMKKYDPSLATNADKEAFSKNYYEKNIKNEKSFLYTYFADASENTVGYMIYVNGSAVSSVMDEEAVNIFWNYIDRYWTDGSLTMNQVFDKTFTKTADTIMTKSVTFMDILKYTIVGIVIIGVGVIIVVLVKQKYKRDKEKAEETAKILNTPLEDSPMDNLKNKYLKK